MATRLNAVVWDETADESPATMSIPAAAGISNVNALALIAAAAALSLGTIGRQETVVDTLLAAGDNNRPGDENAQKEIRYRVGFTDTVNGLKGSFTIPCADLSIKTPGTETVDLTVNPGLALVTALETNGRSSLGNVIVVDSIKFVTL